MERNKLIKKVLSIIEDTIAIDIGLLVPHANLENDLSFDDLDRIEVTMKLEKTFEIIIDDDNMEKWETTGDIIKEMQTLVRIKEEKVSD